jgi:hypothetical protein
MCAVRLQAPAGGCSEPDQATRTGDGVVSKHAGIASLSTSLLRAFMPLLQAPSGGCSESDQAARTCHRVYHMLAETASPPTSLLRICMPLLQAPPGGGSESDQAACTGDGVPGQWQPAPHPHKHNTLLHAAVAGSARRWQSVRSGCLSWRWSSSHAW